MITVQLLGGACLRAGELPLAGPPVQRHRIALLTLIVAAWPRSEEHTSELQSHVNLVCRLLLEKKKKMSRMRFPSCPFLSATLFANSGLVFSLCTYYLLLIPSFISTSPLPVSSFLYWSRDCSST